MRQDRPDAGGPGAPGRSRGVLMVGGAALLLVVLALAPIAAGVRQGPSPTIGPGTSPQVAGGASPQAAAGASPGGAQSGGGEGAATNPGANVGAAAWVPALGHCVPPGTRLPGAASVVAMGSAATPSGASGSRSPAPSAGSSATPRQPSLTAGRVSAPPRWRMPSLFAQVPILMYHRIVAEAQSPHSLSSLEVSPDQFAAQMKALADAGWHSITMRRLAADLIAGGSERPRTVVITFDDGYRDGYLNAAPILRRNGLVGTFFVITGRVGDSDYLTAADLCQLTAQGDEISNHTVHHLGLPELSATRAAWEVDTAASMIQRWTGVAPVTFAYPFGSFDQGVVDHVQTAGYWLAVTNREGAAESWSSRFLVPRIRVGPGMSGASLLVRLSPYAGS